MPDSAEPPAANPGMPEADPSDPSAQADLPAPPPLVLPPPPPDPRLRLTPASAQRAKEWLAVLNAADIRPELQRDGLQWVMLVDPTLGHRAQLEVDAYEEEQQQRERDTPVVVHAPEQLNLGGFAIGLALVALWFITDTSSAAWCRVGEAQGPAILAGQWWRAVTALTLHADVPHLLGNALALWLVGGMLCQRIGAGGGALTIVVAGALGNALTAWIRHDATATIGASTALFAGVGLLGMTQFLHRLAARHQSSWRELGLPLLAVAAFVAFLGTGGNIRDPAFPPDLNGPPVTGLVDVLAHGSGAVCGLLLGLLAPWLARHHTSFRWQLTQALLAVALIALSWLLAWHAA